MMHEMRRMELPDPEFREQHEVVVIFRNGLPVSKEVANKLSSRQLVGLKLSKRREALPEASTVQLRGHRTERPLVSYEIWSHAASLWCGARHEARGTTLHNAHSAIFRQISQRCSIEAHECQMLCRITMRYLASRKRIVSRIPPYSAMLCRNAFVK